MSPQERHAYLALVGNLLINAYVIWWLIQRFSHGEALAPDAVLVWAGGVFRVIVVAMVGTVVAVVLAGIWAKWRAKGAIEAFLSDERDRDIDMKGMIATMVAAVIGFIACIGTLAYGGSVFLALNILYFAFALGSLAGDVTKILLYRRGY